jgi:maltose/moltooligosaccharide transporter
LLVGVLCFPPTDQGKEDAVAWTGLVNGWYNIVTFSVAFSLVAFARRRGAKVVHCVCLMLAAVGLLSFPSIDNKYLLFVPIIGPAATYSSSGRSTSRVIWRFPRTHRGSDGR